MAVATYCFYEKVLRTMRIAIVSYLLIKVNFMPRDNFPKLRAIICNISVSTSDIASVFPQDADSYGLIIVKVKGKLSF